MIRPALQGDALLADIDAAGRTALHLWWLGQSGYLVRCGNAYLLLDPYLSDSLTKKYARTDKPHVRMTEIPISPDRLSCVDVVTSSHNHTDHLDGETLGPLLAANPALTIIVPEANRAFAADRLGVAPEELIGLNAGESTDVAGWRFHGVPAAHETLDQDEHGSHRYQGYVVQIGSWTLYHSGDTVRYEGMVDWLNPYDIDVALLPINGVDPKRGVAGNLSGPETAQLGRDIGAKLVVPCHYEMFRFNTVSPDGFVAAAREVGQPYRLLRCGERLTLERRP